MTIEGPYECFAHLETLYLGVLCRRTRICTNTRRLVEAARPKPVVTYLAGIRERIAPTRIAELTFARRIEYGAGSLVLRVHPSVPQAIHAMPPEGELRGHDGPVDRIRCARPGV